MNEGYIKFNCINTEKDPFKNIDLKELNNYRNILYENKLIGAYDNGIGFGNVSLRCKNTNKFIITGSATGNYKIINSKHYSLVESFDIEKNKIICTGITKASSESLSHAAIYKADKNVKAIIHTHNYKLWKELYNEMPTTPNWAEYGTVEIAKEIFKIFETQKIHQTKTIVMGGHEEGIIVFGESLKQATDIMMNYFK